MKDNISKKELEEIILSGNVLLSGEEIRNLIIKETEKNEKDIDNEFIENCVDLIDKLENKKQFFTKESKKVKFIKHMKSIVIAAVIIVVFVSSVTVSAHYFNMDISRNIVEFINGNAEVAPDFVPDNKQALSYMLQNSNLSAKLKNIGVYPITYPELIDRQCKVLSVQDMTSDSSIAKEAVVQFQYNSSEGNMYISQYNQDFNWEGEDTELKVIKSEIVTVNGMDILIFERKDGSSLRYRDNNTVYYIYIECDINAALEFANSIK